MIPRGPHLPPRHASLTFYHTPPPPLPPKPLNDEDESELTRFTITQATKNYFAVPTPNRLLSTSHCSKSTSSPSLHLLVERIFKKENRAGECAK